MQILQGLSGLRQIPSGSVLSVGNFDGLHRGHDRLLRMANAMKQNGSATSIAIVTFEPHPLTVLRPELAPPRLTPPLLKQSLLTNAGVDDLVILAPTSEVLNLTAEEFWRIVRDEVRPAHMIEGHSFTFGRGRGGNIDKLKQWAADSPVKLDIIDPVSVPLLDLQIVEVSSSLIRWLLANGRARDAAICLGRPYVLEGSVIKGHQRGRALGVPTANLQVAEQLIPADAVYAGRAKVGDTIYPAAVSIGTMPTFGDNARQVEAHLIGFNGDLYNQVLRVELIDWLRDQRRYASLDALKDQLTQDIEVASQRAKIDPSRTIAKSSLSVSSRD
jgi:riboflavin kinase/FMN adenylyltransferase